MKELPTLDLRRFSGPDRAIFLAELRRTAREIGFFYVTGHGVPQDVPEAVLDASRRFFALPEAENLHSFYGKSHILHGVSLEVHEGEIVTLLGRNGAGKTTTLRSLVGLTPPRRGMVKLFGAVVSGLPAYRVAASGLGYVPEGRRIFPSLTVEENLKVPLERPGPFTIPRIFELFPRLAQRRTNKGRQLSGGEQEMLAISRALLLNPKVLLLDEPSQGLAPLVVQDVFKIVASMREAGISVLLVEQNVRAAVAIADRAYVLDDGKVVFAGAAKEFAADEERVRALAGASAESWEGAPH